MRRIYNIDGGMGKRVYARFALLRAGLRRKVGSLFCVFAARLKPCPDTCMACGCGVAVQADAGCAGGVEPTLCKKREGWEPRYCE